MSFCWCGERPVMVDAQMVKDGLTLSCGRNCSPDTARAPTVDTTMNRVQWKAWVRSEASKRAVLPKLRRVM